MFDLPFNNFLTYTRKYNVLFDAVAYRLTINNNRGGALSLPFSAQFLCDTTLLPSPHFVRLGGRDRPQYEDVGFRYLDLNILGVIWALTR